MTSVVKFDNKPTYSKEETFPMFKELRRQYILNHDSIPSISDMHDCSKECPRGECNLEEKESSSSDDE